VLELLAYATVTVILNVNLTETVTWSNTYTLQTILPVLRQTWGPRRFCRASTKIL